MHAAGVLLVVVLTAACATENPTAATPTSAPTATATAVPMATPASVPTAARTASATLRPPTRTPIVHEAQVLWKLPTARRVVALTFDAGSDVGHTADILYLLQARQVHGSFGLTGAWVRANPSLARRIVAEGHQVLNHTDRHLSFTGRSTGTAPLTRQQRAEALHGAELAIVAVTGVVARPWFRPPYGDRDASVDRDVAGFGYSYELMWTVDTLGWKGVAPAEVVRRTMASAGAGAVVLMHVGALSTDWQALPTLLDQLTAAGYGFVQDNRS